MSNKKRIVIIDGEEITMLPDGLSGSGKTIKPDTDGKIMYKKPPKVFHITRDRSVKTKKATGSFRSKGKGRLKWTLDSTRNK